MTTYNGTFGNDFNIGSNANDTMSGLPGNDTLHGGGGDDLIYGGAGNDWITTGYSNSGGFDVAFGEEGNDVLIHGGTNTPDGNCLLVGGNGNDYLQGGTGLNLLMGVENNGPQPGSNDVDIFRGNAVGTDLIFLGDQFQQFYQGNGVAYVVDFTPGQDFFYVHGFGGPYNFQHNDFNSNGTTDTLITNNNNDAIAVVIDSTVTQASLIAL